jgi:hypothetical protein
MSVAYEQVALSALEQIGATTALSQLDQLAQRAAAEEWSYSHFLGRSSPSWPLGVHASSKPTCALPVRLISSGSKTSTSPSSPPLIRPSSRNWPQVASSAKVAMFCS